MRMNASAARRDPVTLARYAALCQDSFGDGDAAFGFYQVAPPAAQKHSSKLSNDCVSSIHECHSGRGRSLKSRDPWSAGGAGARSGVRPRPRRRRVCHADLGSGTHAPRRAPRRGRGGFVRTIPAPETPASSDPRPRCRRERERRGCGVPRGSGDRARARDGADQSRGHPLRRRRGVRAGRPRWRVGAARRARHLIARAGGGAAGPPPRRRTSARQAVARAVRLSG